MACPRGGAPRGGGEQGGNHAVHSNEDVSAGEGGSRGSERLQGVKALREQNPEGPATARWHRSEVLPSA